GRALPTELPGHVGRWLLAVRGPLSGRGRAIQNAIHYYNQCGAGNGTRTRDPKLGRLALYQLSYSRKIGGEGRIRTFEGIAGRFTVCSLWPLGNLSSTPPQKQISRRTNFPN